MGPKLYKAKPQFNIKEKHEQNWWITKYGW